MSSLKFQNEILFISHLAPPTAPPSSRLLQSDISLPQSPAPRSDTRDDDIREDDLMTKWKSSKDVDDDPDGSLQKKMMLT